MPKNVDHDIFPLKGNLMEAAWD